MTSTIGAAINRTQPAALGCVLGDIPTLHTGSSPCAGVGS